MLRRPKPGDSEADLLRAQEEFLGSGAQSAVRVVRRPDKRRGEHSTGDTELKTETCNRDVVTIPDLDSSDQLPALSPVAPKKSKFREERVRFKDEDPEEQLDKHDTHVTAVLSRIIERDASAVPVSFPTFTKDAFPKVFHRSEVADGVSSVHVNGRCVLTCTPSSGSTVTESSRLVSGQGLRQADSAMEALKIHQENQSRLAGMSQKEILEEQQKLLAQLDPRLVDFVKSRKSQDSSALLGHPLPGQGAHQRDHNVVVEPGTGTETDVDTREQEMETQEDEEEPQSPITEEELPVRPQKGWVHMDKLEPEKLEWLRDLPPPRRKGTKRAMQARFHFTGALIPPTEDLPTHLGLHHHGEEPELAGYSLQELFHLSRSQVIQQRSLALTTLARILTKARSGEFTSCLKGSVVSSLLDAGLLFLLRFSLDDSVEGVMAAAAHALRALLVSSDDEEALDRTFSWFLGMEAFPLLPRAGEDEDEDDEALDESMKVTPKEKEERKTDHDVTREDVVKGLLRMKLLPRLRYILEVVRPPARVVLDILEVLIRIARHSSSSATQVLDCPRLLNTVMSEFLPCSWAPSTSSTPDSLHGLPVATAMKLLRVLATSGREACARLLHSMGARERLSRLLALEPQDMLLEPGEAVRIGTEALRLWAVAASYGQACDLYRELYPLLVKVLQSASRVPAPTDPLRPLKLDQSLALLTLLTNITHTAGCHQELQSACDSSQDGDCPPPPPVEWSHVMGLQLSILGWLKGCVKAVEEPALREGALNLLPAQCLYLGAFYSQLNAQRSFQPVECLQELEAFTSEVLLPLLSHQATRSAMEHLKSCSVLCNPKSCSSGPETIASLPGWGCSGGRAMADSSSPFPLLTGLCCLIHTVTSIHRGITRKFSSLLLSDSMLGYMQACCQAMSILSHSSIWLLRHEHQLLYLLLKLAHKLVPIDTEVAKHASLFHEVAVAMISWLLPGSEHLAHDLLATIVFSQDFIPEGRCGGPEAAELSELQLQGSSSPATLGPLLRDACTHLPSLRGCYLSHLAHLEPQVLHSRNSHLGRTPYVRSRLLPENCGPALPSDWPFLPLISLHERAVCPGGDMESLPPAMVESATHCLQWLLVLESWREGALRMVPPAAKLARLCCLFLCSSDLFLEQVVQPLGWGLLRTLTRPLQLKALDLSVPPPGLASFEDLYTALLAQFEAVSFGDPLFGCVVLLPLQRRFSATMKLAVFGEHVGLLRYLGVSLRQLPVPLELYTSPAEDSLPLLQLYFRSLVAGTLRQAWCPVLYVVALAHLNAFIFSQDPAQQTHLLLFKLPQQGSELGFDTYDHLPPIRARRLGAV
ncbi:hypothetical protein JZ751_002674, partial [Albula glossodonta]